MLSLVPVPLSAADQANVNPDGSSNANAQPLIYEGGIVNGASFAAGAVAPGEIVTIFGANLGPADAASAIVGDDGRLVTELIGVRVLFGDEPSPLYFVSSGQISCQVPYSMVPGSSVTVRVIWDGIESAPTTVEIAPSAPGVFRSSEGHVIAVTVDGELIGLDRPLVPGMIATLYATGEGLTTPAGDTGLVVVEPPYPLPVEVVQLWIHGQQAKVLWAGTMPFTAGVMQVNFEVPAEIPAPNTAAQSAETASLSDGAMVPVKLCVGACPGEFDVPLDIVPNLIAPAAAPQPEPDEATTPANSSVVVDVLANDLDPDGDPLHIAVVTQPVGGTVSHDGARITVVPDEDFFGSLMFDYTVSDGSYWAVATVNVTVEAADDPAGENRAPVAMSTSVSLREGESVIFPLTGKDADGDPLTFRIVSNPANGYVQIVQQLDPTTAQASYVHDNGNKTTVSFNFVVNDGLVDSAPAMVTVSIEPVNDIPQSGPVSATVEESGTVVITLNASDDDGDSLTFAITSGPAHGSLGAIAKIDATTAQIAYTHDGSETTSDSFAFTVTDGVETIGPFTVSVGVGATNDTAAAIGGSASVNEGQSTTITLTGTDADGDTLTFAIASGPANGSLGAITPIDAVSAQVTYTHDGSETAADSFTFTANDGSGASAPAAVSITVNPVNDPPTANAASSSVNEGNAVTITLTGTDADGDSLTFAIGSGPSNGSLGAITPINDSTAQVTYTHNGGETASDSFTFTVDDGSGASAPSSVSIAVNPVNDPGIANAASATVDEGASVVISLSGSDVDGDTLTFAVGTGPSHGTLGAITHLTDTTAQVTYTHNGGEDTADSFTFTVSDGTVVSSPATASITINPVNDAPSAVVTSATVEKGGTVEVMLWGYDVDGDALTFAIASGPTNGTLGAITVVNDNTAKVTYTHDGGDAVKDKFTFTVNDGVETSTPGSANITITVPTP